MPERLRVTAPASSANLGPGLRLPGGGAGAAKRGRGARHGGGGLRVVVEGEGAGAAPDRPRQPVRAGVRGRRRRRRRGSTCRMQNRVPFARGLGSSAATIAAGVVAGAGLVRTATATRWNWRPIWRATPTTSAAALDGGLTLAWKYARRARGRCGWTLPGRVRGRHPRLRAVHRAGPRRPPPQVPHYDAAHTAGRAALLVAALTAGRIDLIADALDDRLHEPYRAPLVPLLAEVGRRIATCRRWAPRCRVPGRRCWCGASRSLRPPSPGAFRGSSGRRRCSCRWQPTVPAWSKWGLVSDTVTDDGV